MTKLVNTVLRSPEAIGDRGLVEHHRAACAERDRQAQLPLLAAGEVPGEAASLRFEPTLLGHLHYQTLALFPPFSRPENNILLKNRTRKEGDRSRN